MIATTTAQSARPMRNDGTAEPYSGWLRRDSKSVAIQRTLLRESLVDFRDGWTELWRLKWTRAVESTWHTDPCCYFLSLVLDGVPDVERRNVALARATPYGGGRVSLVPPSQMMRSSSPVGGEVHTMRCFIDAALIDSICERKPTAEELARLGSIDFNGGPIEWLLFRMYREMCGAKIGTRIAVESIARMIAVEIARQITVGDSAHRHAGGLPAWRMRLLLDRIRAEGPLPGVGELATVCGMSPRHLSRAFREETGNTLGSFVAAIMVERAGKMLSAGDPVGAVAMSMGYSSSSSFAHAFQRETGLLPSDFRDEQRLRRC